MKLANTLMILLCLLGLSTQSAEARHHRVHVQQAQQCEDLMCSKFAGANTHAYGASGSTANSHSRIRTEESASYSSRSGLAVAHPSGCPSRAFCGCGASIEVFGHSVRELWLASNWLKFPRAAPAPGMAMVRSHHVAILRQHVSGSDWLVYDANSGGRRTRIHVRSIAGFTIVNPRA